MVSGDTFAMASGRILAARAAGPNSNFCTFTSRRLGEVGPNHWGRKGVLRMKMTLPFIKNTWVKVSNWHQLCWKLPVQVRWIGMMYRGFSSFPWANQNLKTMQIAMFFICSYNQSGNRSQTIQTDQNFAESNPSTKIQNPKRHRSSYIYKYTQSCI